MILRDADLQALIDNPQPIIRGVRPPLDWYSMDSPIQPASVDLNIGKILIPGTKRTEPGGESDPLSQYVLRPGQTAVVTTLEELSLPDDMAAIGFPPSRVSFQGILMTNPGQVDPGYIGRMRFTVINMGSKDFVLRKGDVIVSLIVFRLPAKARADWVTRRAGEPGRDPTQQDLDRLAPDFLEVERRATKIASDIVNKGELQIKRYQTMVPVWSALAAAVVYGLLTIFSLLSEPRWREPLTQVQKDVAALKERTDINDLKSRVKKLEEMVRTGRDRVDGTLPRENKNPNLPGSPRPDTPDKR